nr:uncharacterized protein LOC116769267 [Danaus plexippus plexippus]
MGFPLIVILAKSGLATIILLKHLITRIEEDNEDPSYSPDLTPSDYWLIGEIKKMLAGKKFRVNEEVSAETEAHFEAKDKSFYKSGIEMLERLWNDCYSPDLAPSDYWLFGEIKKMLASKKFRVNEEVIAETEAYFEAKDKSFYKSGIEMLERRWNDCIALDGDYVAELS